jgi:hypothetical protein
LKILPQRIHNSIGGWVMRALMIVLCVWYSASVFSKTEILWAQYDIAVLFEFPEMRILYLGPDFDDTDD